MNVSLVIKQEFDDEIASMINSKDNDDDDDDDDD